MPAAPAHEEVSVTPKTIGRGDAYQIVSTIGRGGFATVLQERIHAALTVTLR